MTKHEDKKGNKKDAKGGNQSKQQQSKKAKEERESAPAESTTSLYPEGFRMAENLTKKDQQKLEKIVASIEYAEAHDNREEANKLWDRLNQTNEQLRAKAAHKAERLAERTAKGEAHGSTKVTHNGGKTHKVPA